jgi:AcrR family transcriptional regulator
MAKQQTGQKRGKAAATTPSKRAGSKRAASSRQQKTAARRDAILDAALTEFSEQGFTAARLDDVARRAGVAKGTIYLYFRDKDALFQQLIHTMLTPVVGSVETLGRLDIPMRVLADRMIDLFVDEIFSTRRRDVIRLMISEGRRFPKLAEFYYREVLSRIFVALRAVLQRAADRGEIPQSVVTFPQMLIAPGLVAVVWAGLFDRAGIGADRAATIETCTSGCQPRLRRTQRGFGILQRLLGPGRTLDQFLGAIIGLLRIGQIGFRHRDIGLLQVRIDRE